MKTLAVWRLCYVNWSHSDSIFVAFPPTLLFSKAEEIALIRLTNLIKGINQNSFKSSINICPKRSKDFVWQTSNSRSSKIVEQLNLQNERQELRQGWSDRSDERIGPGPRGSFKSRRCCSYTYGSDEVRLQLPQPGRHHQLRQLHQEALHWVQGRHAHLETSRQVKNSYWTSFNIV